MLGSMMAGSPAPFGSLSSATFSFIEETGSTCVDCADRSRQHVKWNGSALNNAVHYITVEEDEDDGGYVERIDKADDIGPVGYQGSFGQTGTECTDGDDGYDGAVTCTFNALTQASGDTYSYKYRVKLYWKATDELLSTVETSRQVSVERGACIQ